MVEDGYEDEVDDDDDEGFNLKWVIIGLVVVILIAAGGGIAWLLLVKNGNDNAGTDLGTVSIDRDANVGKIYKLETFVVNLSDPGGRRYLKTKIELELVMADDEDEEMTARLPQIRDSILMHLSSKAMEDIQGTTGKIALRNELIMRLNQILKKIRVKNLYFTEFVVQ